MRQKERKRSDYTLNVRYPKGINNDINYISVENWIKYLENKYEGDHQYFSKVVNVENDDDKLVIMR